MRDTAAMADQSAPNRNRQARRLWEPPPLNRKRPRCRPEALHLDQKTQPIQTDYDAAEACAQRAVAKARARAQGMDRLADALLQMGYGKPAERLSHKAHSLREAVLT